MTRLVLGIWFFIALGIGYAGLLARMPVPPPAVAIVLTVVSLVLWRIRAVREHVRRGGPAPLVAFHLTRAAAGAYFLWSYRRGELPAEFAVVAGWGDLAVAVAAVLVLVFCIPVRTRRQEIGLLAWNAFGLADILFVLSRGIRIFLADPSIGVAFTELPLALLPTMVVPLVIASHVVLFVSPDTRRR